jgi:HEPN domain-containing protein
MDDARRQLVRAWRIRAQHDLDTAGLIAGLPQGHLDTAIYHCQQAAEKVVKAFLALHDHPLERTHDVERLVTIAATYDQRFGHWTESGVLLSPYATAYRYPGEGSDLEPTRAEFDEALSVATEFVSFVLTLLPADETVGDGR